MKSKFLMLITVALFSVYCSHAQLGNLLKKKKESTAQPSDTASMNKSEGDKALKEKKHGGGFLQKLTARAAKIVGNTVMGASGMTSVGNLADADVIVSVGTNIFSKDLGLMFTDFLGGEWINNGDFTMLQIASKDGFKFYKYDGTIKVNGKELKHASMGIHTVTETPGNGNKKISFEKNGTVEGSFEIPLPSKNIKLVSINGQAKDAKVDFTKDVELEIANYSSNPNSLIRVDIITTQIGMRTLSLLAYVKPASKIIIPSAAFKNIENENKFNLKNCYLNVSDQQLVKAINPIGKISTNQMVITGSNDGMWIDVLNNPEVNKGINDIPGVAKRNAAFAMPLSFAKKIAVGCFYTQGVTQYYSEKEKTEEKSTYDVKNHTLIKETTKTKVTETKEVQFPQISDSYLNSMLAELYTKISSAFNEVNGSTVLPANTIPNTPSYATSMKFMAQDENTKAEFLKSYSNLMPMSQFSNVFNLYYGTEAMLNEVNADALLKVTLTTSLEVNSGNAMKTRMTVELVGPSNGSFRSFMGNTKFFTMELEAPQYEMKRKQEVEFSKVFQVDYFVNEFKTKLAQLKAKEDAMKDYDIYWNLQR